MTVGILGMAFKAESDDIRVEPGLQAQAHPAVQGANEVLCTDPYVTTDPTCSPLDEVVARSDLLIIATPHARVPRRSTLDVPVVDIWNLRGEGTTRVTAARVSVVIPVYNEGDAIEPVLDRLVEAVTLPCEVLVVVDSADDTTVAAVEKYARDEPRLPVASTRTGAGRRNAIRFGIDTRRRRSSS